MTIRSWVRFPQRGVFSRFIGFPPELVYRHHCLVEMDMIGWFYWWYDDTLVIRQ
ncbi:hypothetical protein HanRHA438_Chr03g0107811 [Helianthus annuus]|nr:hypothetical protein HanIR_Chr03g0105591 [Helianthus annuus]KAJ0934470.1 hypothetical protein HanRHA438_Chr03g0107811 [Helianthus annuus]